jgi:hypothetical protein
MSEELKQLKSIKKILFLMLVCDIIIAAGELLYVLR